MQSPSVPPILEITDGHGALLWHARIRVLSTMFHPDDEERRERLFQAMVMAAVAEAGEPIPPELVPFSKSPEETESLMDLAGESACGVSVTGDLLLGIINALFQSPKDASLARAILRIKRRRSGGIRGRPDWHFSRQNSWKPLRCQPMKVLGVTTVNAVRQLNQRLSTRSVKRAGGEVRRVLTLRSW